MRLDYPDIEIIIIDGGSSDRTLEIIQKYSSRLYYFISEADQGIYDAWNKAINVSRGDWLAFIGADDQWMEVGSLSNLMRMAIYPDINYVSGKAFLADNNGQNFGKKFDYPSLTYGMRFIHVGSLHHKTLFINYGSFDINFKIAGDYDFFVRNGRYIRPAFYPGEVILMGANGLSNVKHHKVFFESFKSLNTSSDFGPIKAAIFLVKSYLVLVCKSLILIAIKK
jgi:glycosyltransferase involved in cell wall biosynthesis